MSYGSKLRAQLDPDHPCNRSFGSIRRIVSDDVVDLEYRKKLYNTQDGKKPKICKVCNIAISRSGCCDC